MRHLQKLFKLYPKLILSFLIVLTPVYAISLMMNNYAERNVQDKIEESMKSSVNFYIRQLESDFNRIIRMQEEFVNDRDVGLLSGAGEIFNDFDWRNAVINTRSRLTSLRNLNSYVREASIYLPSEKRLISSAAAYGQLSEVEYDLLKSASRQVGNPFVYGDDRLYVSFPFSNLALINGREPRFLVSAEIDGTAVGDVLDTMKIDGNGGAFVVGHDENWLLHGKTSSTDFMHAIMDSLQLSRAEGEKVLRIDGQTYWVNIEKSQKLGFSLIMYMPETQMLGALKQFRVWFWVLSVISVLIIIVFSYWIFLQIHQPLRRLIQAFRGLENGTPDKELVYKRSDEFGYLYQQYNHSVSRIKELIHEVYEQQYRANLSELRQLQSQINPHFLYNNFFILYRMAKNEENDNIARFTSYLGKYFQFITRTQKGQISLAEETAFSQTYVDIQSFRFEDRIIARFAELPEHYANVEVPKLILQPIIENVYHHGLSNTLEGGLLEVRFKEEGNKLFIIVEDNGEEMQQADYDELQHKLQASSGWSNVETTGVINVHRRLRLEFGEEGGVVFNRRPGGGNQVILCIPLVQEHADKIAISEKGRESIHV
ncbi:two-component system sensor histidine kinase YesM [Paenibacillus qinlingensis]|uniref:Two-component system sensor histidine kinase YesM n=1 Tax=Paenibacillus qinlingensis TaxID=1837343 RepID=A0ABU1NX57_9BACL|nr:two-component system sensor histidine kinase YesM [Paenibacillus qinlingensis]